MLRIVADTNIYISALNFGGLPDQILALARRRRVELFISKAIIDEIEGVLRKKFHWPANRVREALILIRQFTRIVEPSERIGTVEKDEADNRILECAVAAKANVIISGDSHLRNLGLFRDTRILSARAFLEAIGG